MNLSILRNPLLSKGKPRPKANIKSEISIVLMIIAGSIFPVFGKKLTTAFSPLSLLFISEMLGGLFVLMSFGLIPLLKKIRKLKKKEVTTLIALGISTGIIAPYLWFTGLQSTTAVNAELFSRSEIIFLIILSFFLLHEKINKNQLLSLAVIIFGVLCVALKGFTVAISLTKGDILILSSSIAYAFGGVIVKKDLKKVHPELIIFIRAASATTFFFCSSAFVSQNFISELRNMPSDILYALFIYGFVGKFIGIYGFHEAIETLKVATVSMFSTLSIIGGMLLAAFYLGEHIYMYQIAGASLIVLGVLLMQYVGVHENRKVHEHHIRQHHRHHI